jgi:quercetin dioxygenase-like cupin family protein
MVVALAACAASPAAVALADQPQAMGSRIFDWNATPSVPNETGSVKSFCKARTATLNELEMHATTLEPGKASHPPHKHPNEELIILKQGTLEAYVNGEWKRVETGSIIFAASNQLHGVRNVGSEPAIYHVINWRSPLTPEA